MSWNTLTVNPPTGNAADAAENLSLIMVTPWQQGEGVGTGARLSFPNAVQLISKKLDNSLAGVGIAVTAATYSDFSTICTQLITPFPFPILQQWKRRSLQLSLLEKSKRDLVSNQSSLSGFSVNALPAIQTLQIADIRQQAFDDAETFKSSTPLTNLTDFETAKNAHDTEVSGVQAAAKSGLSGGAGWRFYAANDVVNALFINAPGSENTITAILLFQGSVSDLSLLAEVIQ